MGELQGKSGLEAEALVPAAGSGREVSGHGWKAEAGCEGRLQLGLATHRSLWQGGSQGKSGDKESLHRFCSLQPLLKPRNLPNDLATLGSVHSHTCSSFPLPEPNSIHLSRSSGVSMCETVPFASAWDILLADQLLGKRLLCQLHLPSAQWNLAGM